MITSFDDFFKNFEVNNIEYLTELLVGSDKKLKISIHVDPDPNRKGDEYFKIYNSDEYSNAENIARIKFREPSYVVHKRNRHGKKNYKLVSDEKDDLIDFLNSKNHKKPELTNWEYAIILFNRKLGLSDEKTKKNLIFDKNSKYNDKYLPFDLKMPNYKNLPD